MRFFKYIFLSSFVFSYELSGYLEMNIDAFSKQNFYYLGYNKIRCNVLNEINDDILFEASLIGKNNYGKKTFILNDYLPYTEDGYFEGFDPMNINDSVYFDYLYFIYLKNNYKMILGKQPVYFGSGYVWNPVNNLTFKNSIDPTYEIPGLNVIRLQYFSSNMDYDFIMFPDNDGMNVDLHLSVGSTVLNQSVRLYSSRFINREIVDEVVLENIETAIGFSHSGAAFFNIGLWSEVYSYFNSKRNDWMIGFDYTLDSGIYVMYERYHQNIDNIPGNYYQSNTLLNYLAGYINAIGTDYSFFTMAIYMDDYTRISLNRIDNLFDGSGILFPQIDYSLMDDVDLSFSFYLFEGDYTKEFGLNDWGFRSRIQIYF